MPDSKTSLGIEATVCLREITQETVNSILNLRVTKEQEQFVASNAVSIAEAHFSEDAWFRAIYADETPVGFLMLSDQPTKGNISYGASWLMSSIKEKVTDAAPLNS